MSLQSKPIIIFGETLIDDFPDQPVVGGAPFNVARSLGYFDCAPLMISRVGNDATAQLIRADMQRFKLPATALQTDQHYPTGRVKVTQDDSADMARHKFEILPDQAYDHIDGQTAVTAMLQASPEHDQGIFYFGTLAQRNPVSREALYGLLAQTRALKYLDLNLRAMQYSLATIEQSLQFADILKVNEEELQILAEIYLDKPKAENEAALDDRDIQTHATALIALFKLQAIITTLGERGYAYLDEAGQYLRSASEAVKVEVVDTVGGGDAFSAIFILGMQRGWPLHLSLQRAHLFAAGICSVRGAVASDADFYEQWQQCWNAETLPAIASSGANP
ncbi:PfkB family carbohydrate kinase [Undibacterium pigrum]|uniref:Fructokinase n=1 Tax=Undibacterium pigrum TaxID=401470 RepID=A0A318IP82_9BURK|nr:PfkB family carbohydrate kinase [Undibacterium pigrum]PXX37876.1 fructokinase [Undibacterium pigrum]